MTDSNLLTLIQAANLIGIRRTTLQTMKWRGQFIQHTEQKLGNNKLYHRNDILLFIDRNAQRIAAIKAEQTKRGKYYLNDATKQKIADSTHPPRAAIDALMARDFLTGKYSPTHLNQLTE